MKRLDTNILSRFSQYAENAIEEENSTAQMLAQSGKRIIRLNIGDPAKFFPTPKYMVDAYINALKEGKTGYCDPEGILELREAVSNRYKRIYNIDVNPNYGAFITHGVSEALIFLNSILVNPGDRAVMFKPYYAVCYSGFRVFGGEPIFQEYQEDREWDVDTDDLDRKIKATKKDGKAVKYLMVTNPSNPTGMVLDRNVIERIADIANNNDLVLISDEIYDEVVYNGAKFTSVSQVAKGIPHIIFNGASKDLDATGFRIGFVVVPGDDAVSRVLKKSIYDFCAIRLCVSTPAQYAVAEGINNIVEHRKAIDYFIREIEDRANFASKMINDSDYMHVIPPRGAYYLFPKLNMEKLDLASDKDFVHKLLEEEGVLLTRGSGFGGEDHVRLVALPQRDVLADAIEKIDKFCERHSK